MKTAGFEVADLEFEAAAESGLDSAEPVCFARRRFAATGQVELTGAAGRNFERTNSGLAWGMLADR